MTDDTIVNALIRRRRELTHDIDELFGRIDAIVDDVRAIDQVMLLYRPDIVPDAIPALRYRPRDDWAKRGEIQRPLFDILREAAVPLACGEITRRLMVMRQIDVDQYAVQRKRISRSLERMRERGLIESCRSGAVLLWHMRA